MWNPSRQCSSDRWNRAHPPRAHVHRLAYLPSPNTDGDTPLVNDSQGMGEASEPEESQSQNMDEVWMVPIPEPEVELTPLKPNELDKVLMIKNLLGPMRQSVSVWCRVLGSKEYVGGIAGVTCNVNSLKHEIEWLAEKVDYVTQEQPYLRTYTLGKDLGAKTNIEWIEEDFSSISVRYTSMRSEVLPFLDGLISPPPSTPPPPSRRPPRDLKRKATCLELD